MEQRPKLKRTLGFNASYGAAVGLVVSGTAMFSVGSVAGISGYATFISAGIALIPMMATALAFGELASMIPGGGMIGDYTAPALGKFWGSFAVLSCYITLIACDGGTQLVMGGLSTEEMIGIPQIAVSLFLLLMILLCNLFDVGIYGKVEGFVTIVMMIVYALLAILGTLGAGAAVGGAVEVQNTSFMPEGGAGAVFGSVGTAIWFYIGYEFTCPMAEENKKPYRNIPLALILGLISIYIVDTIFVMGAVRYANLEELVSSAIPQTVASVATMGTLGGILMSCLTICASFTTGNAYMAGLPRMMYGLAHEKQVPAVFMKVHPKYRVPMAGIILTTVLILLLTVYITAAGGTSDVITMFINCACVTWLITYSIAMIDVLVLRKKYPNYPRLWKMPCAKVIIPIGLLGALYAIYTLAYVVPAALIICLAVILYLVIWNKVRKQPVNEIVPLDVFIRRVRQRSEYLPVWDEAVVEWMESIGVDPDAKVDID